MTKTVALRNPVLRRKNNMEVESPVASLGTELKEQELDSQIGAGNTIDLITTIMTPTPDHGCGGFYTISLECTGKKC